MSMLKSWGLGGVFKRKPDMAPGALPSCAPAHDGPPLEVLAPQAACAVTNTGASLSSNATAGVPGCHVLVVEDHAVSRKVMGLLLQSLGHRVSFAENGAVAFAQVSSRVFDLVLMDVHMPVMDGLTCARQIRALPGPYGRVPMVALTSDVRESLVEEAQRAGMQQVLSKPLQKSHLERVLPPKRPAP